MGRIETPLQQAIRLELGKETHLRLFRNNVGLAYPKGSKRPVQYGLCPGSSDLIGLRSIQITPDMVGKTIAQFVAIEVKPRRGLTQEQAAFLRVVDELGGLAVEARSLEDIQFLKK